MEKRNDYATCHITPRKKGERKVLHVTMSLRRIGCEFFCAYRKGANEESRKF